MNAVVAAPKLDSEVTISLFKKLKDTKARPLPMRWPDLLADFSKGGPFQGDEQHPGWSPAEFDPPTRKRSHVKHVTMLVLDVDNAKNKDEPIDNPITVEQAKITYAAYQGLIQTTRNHTIDWPRFRVILPLTRPVTRAEYDVLWQAAARRWPGLDPAPKDPSRFWYMPGVIEQPGAEFVSVELHGEPLDPDVVMGEVEPEPVAPAPKLALVTSRATEPSANLIERARAYIAAMPAAISGQGGHKATFNVARKLRDFGIDQHTALGILREYNARCEPPWSEDDLHYKLEQGYNANVSNPVENRPPPGKAGSNSAALAVADPSVIVEPKEPRFFPLTETGNGERLVRKYRGLIRYSTEREKWLTFDGERWCWDGMMQAEQYAKATARAIYEEASKCEDEAMRKALAAHARGSEKMSARSAMLRAAMSEPGIPVLLSELDTDPWLLNCKNGTLDLRTGKLQQHNAGDLITKSTGLDYDPKARSELWTKVLTEAVGGDAELAWYLQRIAGYSLIGLAIERAFFFLYGPPGTAKSTLIDALIAALGDYAVTADFETWLMRNNPGGNRGDIVRLAGARLVTSVEGRHGGRWDEALIKRVTGGDIVTACAKFEHDVSYRPSYTLLLAANDAPTARDDDSGLWARMRRIPLTTQILKQDITIKEQLKQPGHAEAVLAWAVAGCFEYQKNGLGSAKIVEQSTAEYRAENDHFASFLADRFELVAGERFDRARLNALYKNWCEDGGRRKMLDHKEREKRLIEAGCILKWINGHAMWDGLRLRVGETGTET
jgi:putative DNA primase/helicase